MKNLNKIGLLLFVGLMYGEAHAQNLKAGKPEPPKDSFCEAAFKLGMPCPEAEMNRVSLAIQARPQQKFSFVLREGTPIAVRLTQALDTRSSAAGDPVEMEVCEDVRVDGQVVIRRHAAVWGNVDVGTIAPRRGGLGGVLKVSVNEIAAVTGDTVRVRGFARAVGADLIPNSGLDALVLLLLKGDDAIMNRGTILIGSVEKNVAFDPQLVATILARPDEHQRLASKGVLHIYRSDRDLENAPRRHLDLEEISRLDPSREIFVGTPGITQLRQGLLPVRVAAAFGGRGDPISMDDQPVATLEDERFLTIQVEPGTHTLSTRNGTVQLNVERGTERYARMYRIGTLHRRTYLELVSNSDGDMEMATLLAVNSRFVQEPWRSSQDDSPSHFGLYFAGGETVVTDKEGRDRLLSLANEGNAVAQNNLAALYYRGAMGQRNYAEAFAWLVKAANQGLPVAYMNLGYLYEQGQAVPQDYVKAYAWYSLAEGREEHAKDRMDIAADYITLEQMSQAVQIARKLAPASPTVASN